MISRKLIKEGKRSMQYVWGNVLAQWIGLMCNIGSIFTMAALMYRMIQEEIEVSFVIRSVGIISGCVCLRFVMTMLATKWGYLAGTSIKSSLREKIYGKLLTLGFSYRRHAKTSEVIQMTVEGVDQLEIYFGKYLPQLFYSLLAPITLFFVFLWVNVWAALVLFVCVPLIPLSIVAVQKIAKKLLAKYWGSYTTLGDYFLENLQGLTTLKIYGADQFKQEEMNRQSEAFRKVTMKVLVMQLNSITVMDIIAYGGAAMGVIVSVMQYAKGNVGIAGCFAMILLAAEFFIPLRILGSLFHVVMNGVAAGDRIFRLLEQPEEERGLLLELQLDQGVELRNVCFSYDDQRVILDSVSMQAGVGITGIVGQSGCGKTTIATLLMGQNSNYEGSMTIGGKERRDIDRNQLLSVVTLISHNSYLFKGTIRENLRMANAKATDRELWDTLDKVRLSDFLNKEKGLDTLLTEGGGNFSGGQRQRLALARAILHDTAIYVFDEATSNIDAESEDTIMQVIQEMSAKKIVLLISHRLVNLARANKIYVMEKGKIVEWGTHHALVKKRGIYTSLYKSQQELEQIKKGGKLTCQSKVKKEAVSSLLCS